MGGQHNVALKINKKHLRTYRTVCFLPSTGSAIYCKSRNTKKSIYSGISVHLLVYHLPVLLQAVWGIFFVGGGGHLLLPVVPDKDPDRGPKN